MGGRQSLNYGLDATYGERMGGERRDESLTNNDA